MSEDSSGKNLIFRLTVPDFLWERNARGVKSKKGLVRVPCVPSWNDMLALDEWGRRRLKEKIADVFLCELQACCTACATTTTSVKKSLSIYAATLACYRTTIRDKRKLRQSSARQKKAKSPIR